nr:hypothetical protein CFP56_11375 [Quercus suber]
MSTSTSQAMNEQALSSSKGILPAMENALHPRRVLGEVSPNVKAVQSSNKPMMGSPLKRSFTAMAEQGSGFQYLKRRKGSDENAIDQSKPAEKPHQPQGSPRRVFKNTVVDETPASEPMPDDEQIQEPSPTEPNTPSSLNDDQAETQSSSLDRKSFSSLINFEPSSQTSQARATSETLLPPPSRAELLRLRLRVAMYKVRTNQIDIPFAQLQNSTHHLPQGQHPPPQTATSRAVEEAVAQLRREAQRDLARRSQAHAAQAPPQALQLLPAPVLLPTAYSSRMIYEPHAPPSSPPDAAASQDRRMAHATPQPQRTLAIDPDLTSSVVKGRVAEGLLGLRNAAH